MKKILFLLLSVLLYAGAAAASDRNDYRVLLLGDVHYDGAAYHQTTPAAGYRARERQRNLNMWQGPALELLACAAAHIGKDMPFVIQLGDITQGDCENTQLHERMFKDAFTQIKKSVGNHRLLVVKGNHDVRLLKNNKSSAAAANALLPLVAKELGIPALKTGNYTVMQGRDLYIFVDGFVPGGETQRFVAEALKKHPQTRYVFLLTHLPLLPCSTGSPDWLLSAHYKIGKMLAERKGIVLAGHTHVFSHLVYRYPQGGELPQLVVTSMGSEWRPGTAMTPKIEGYPAFCGKLKTPKKPYRFLKEFGEGTFPAFTVFSGVSGYVVLEINDRQVIACLHTGKPGAEQVIRIILRENKTTGQ